MRVEDLEPLRDLAAAAKTFSLRHEWLYLNREWYSSERGGALPVADAQEMIEAQARLLAAARALVESAGAERDEGER